MDNKINYKLCIIKHDVNNVQPSRKYESTKHQLHPLLEEHLLQEFELDL